MAIVNDRPVGYAWLREVLNLNGYHLTHYSYIGTRAKMELDADGNVIETYSPNYTPQETALANIEFALKYDNLNLDLLHAVFKQVSEKEVVEFIKLKPKGGYERRIGFLYEFLTGKQLPVPDQGKANYIDLIDKKKYITGTAIKNKRWNINDNLLGNREFCPVIRKTIPLDKALQVDYTRLIADVEQAFPPAIYHRAVNYLYAKETRSSYQIENERPSLERVTRFIRLLERAGEIPIGILLNEENLTRLQQSIVDPRFAATGFRDFQNYIGQTTYNYKELIHYICPPPEYIRSIMEGLRVSAEKTNGISPVVRAAIIAFGFVFAHPFEDGNGRLHRFLIHDILVRDKLVPPGMIVPVSAHMVNHMREYDKALESFSVPLMERIRYEIKENYSLIVTNKEEIESYFRYPDLTDQTFYLLKTVRDTITEDIYAEMEFLLKYDEIKQEIQDIVDMPDREIDLIIKLLHQNNGKLSKRKRIQFEKLSDKEIEKIEYVFREIFNIPH